MYEFELYTVDGRFITHKDNLTIIRLIDWLGWYMVWCKSDDYLIVYHNCVKEFDGNLKDGYAQFTNL